MLEILAPAGSMESAEAAINNGTDAIYLGLSSFSARQSAENFDGTAFRAVLKKAHFCGIKVYVAMNTVVKNEETEAFLHDLLFAWNEGADAIILQDALLGKLIHARYPEIVLHLSTQAGVCNEDGAKFAKECGFSRVILARETPLADIKKITQIIETEAFVQGALCTSFSGQCYFSSFAGGNSGNRGRCKQPCRKLCAYNRNGNTEKSYALSLSDLSVGEEIAKLIEAGVVSFKIEGRMRRAEYVAAAVRYYRILLDGSSGAENALSDLRRTYNRGNYTRGLAFGQDKRFLSTAIQGHIGEKIGVVKVINGKFFVESKFIPSQGDAFKILREGKELGGASFLKAEGRGFILSSRHRLKNGDGVFITTDTAVNQRVLQAQRTGKLTISLYFTEGKKALAVCGDISIFSEDILSSAENRPLTKKEVVSCFEKTDGLPVEIEFENVELNGNMFLPKSKLNAFRRAFYNAVAEKVMKNEDRNYEYAAFQALKLSGRNEKKAVISSDFSGVETDIAIYKPEDFRNPLPANFINGNFEKYLYYPAFCTGEDRELLLEKVKTSHIDGIYTDNYGGILFAREQGLKIFAGTGLNLLNSLSVTAFLGLENATYYAVSKEANTREGTELISEKAFILSYGNIKLMDLLYCPFGKTCKQCDKKDIYSLTDENGRVFPVRRYISANGSCRFEVYNCADLIGNGIGGAGKLVDLTVTQEKACASFANTEEKQKEIYTNYTSGHFKRGVL